MSADTDEVAAVIAVESAHDATRPVVDWLHAVAADHGGTAMDRVATFRTVSDGLLAVAGLLRELPQLRCGVVILDGHDVAGATSEARAVAGAAESGQIAVVAMRHGARIRLGVLHGGLESMIIARTLSQPPAAASGTTTSGVADGLRAKLSPAEYRVAAAVGRGATNKEVAGQLFISVKTVDYHLQNIYRKLGARSRTELAVLVADAARAVDESGLGEDQLRFVQALADQPPVARWATGIPGIDLADETGD